MSVLALSPELLRQLASTLTARRVSGVSGPVFGYLLGSPSNAVLSEDQNDGYRTTAVAADAAGAVTAIGALMLPPGLADGRHIACGSFGSLASFATSVPDGVPFLGVVAIAPDVASSADGEEGSSSAAASAFGAALNESPASKKASDLDDTDFASFVDESVRGNLEYWSENLSILRGHPSTQPAGTELGASFPLLVVLPNAADALVPEAGEESKGSDIVYVTCDGPERINEACLRAFTVSPPSEEELDAAYAAAESKDVEGEEEAEAAAIKVSPLSLSTSTEYPSQASNWGVLRRSVTLRVPTVTTAYNGTLGAAAYLRSAITSNPSIACLLPPSAIAVAEGPSPPADIVVAAEAVKGVRVGGVIVAAEVQGIEPVLLSYKEQGPSMDAVFSVTPNESGIVDVIVYPSTAAAAPPAGSVIGTAVAAPGASTFPLTTTPLAHREPLTVTLTAFSCLPCVLQGQSKPVTLARAVSRLHRCLQDQLSLICGLFESSPLLLHQSGLLLGGNGSRSGCANGRGWPALALAPAAVPAKGMSLLGDKPADGNSSAAPPLMHNEPLRPAMANLLAKLLSPFLPRLPTPYASQVAQAAHPSVLVPTSIDVVPVAPASLWRIPLLAVVPRFQYDSAAAEAAAASGAGESFGTAAAAAVAAEQSAALSAVATALVPSGGSILPSPNAEGLPLTSAEAADEIRRSLLPPPVEGVSLLPAGAVVRAAREAPLRAALTWRFGALTSEQPLRLVGSDPIEEDDLGAGRLVGVHARAPLPESFVSGQQQGKKGALSSLSLDGDRITVALSTGKSEFCHYGPLPASSFSTSGASSSLSSSSSTDKGWGCAYRSLQTIVSWFRLNHALTPSSHPHLRGPVSLPAGSPAAAACVGVPSHVAIQTALVALGDKPASLRGSAQWIGAVELALVLQGLYGLRARLVSVASGDGVRSHARELVKHFQEQGSPVMVGGGELALTVMGVAINEESGDVRYLIMDPHYTGEDDAEVVVGTGRGCVWRGDEVWDRNAFYNILLPQRPTVRVDL